MTDNRKLKLQAYAKINLSLDVTGIRPNGYHDVDMVMQTISLHDEVEIALTEEPGIILTNNLPWLPCDSRNIAYRAAELMLEKFKDINCQGYLTIPGVRIHITKNIPVAAGMAGGSTDGAAVIRGMNELLEMNLTTGEMMEIGVRLGADVPFCICGGTMHSEGIGEILNSLPPMPDCYILTVKPPYSVSTGDVYAGIDRILFADNGDKSQKNFRNGSEDMPEALKSGDIGIVSASLFNVLELYTAACHDDIPDIKKLMLSDGALGSLMSGSGPTVFGIFESEAQAGEAAKNILCKYRRCDIDISVPVNMLTKE